MRNRSISRKSLLVAIALVAVSIGAHPASAETAIPTGPMPPKLADVPTFTTPPIARPPKEFVFETPGSTLVRETDVWAEFSDALILCRQDPMCIFGVFVMYEPFLNAPPKVG